MMLSKGNDVDVYLKNRVLFFEKPKDRRLLILKKASLCFLSFREFSIWSYEKLNILLYYNVKRIVVFLRKINDTLEKRQKRGLTEKNHIRESLSEVDC